MISDVTVKGENDTIKVDKCYCEFGIVNKGTTVLNGLARIHTNHKVYSIYEGYFKDNVI